MAANLPMGNNKITSLAAGSAAADAVRYDQISSLPTTAVLAASNGSSLFGFLQTGTNAVARTGQDKFRERVSVEDFYNVSMGTDWTLAWQRAIASLPSGGVIEYTTPGTCDITATLTTTDAAPITIRGKGDGTIIRKLFNGDMFNLGARSTLQNIKLDGNGATYTGRGIICSTGAVDLVSWRDLDNVTMINMASYCVEYTAAIAGYGSEIRNSRLGTTAVLTAAVKLPASETNGNRQMINVYTSGILFDAAGCNNHAAINCEGAAPILVAASVKVRILGCRIPFSVTVPTMVVDGTDTLVTGCEIGCTGITFNVGLQYCNWIGNDDIGAGATFTDNADGTNRITLPKKLYTPTWTATAGVPAIGNGSLGGSYIRRGENCKVTVTLNIGSTTTTTGTTWLMTVPYTASRNQSGSVFINDQGTGQYVGTAIVIANTNTVQFISTNSVNAVGASIPMIWTTSDYLIFDIDYTIK